MWDSDQVCSTSFARVAPIGRRLNFIRVLTETDIPSPVVVVSSCHTYTEVRNVDSKSKERVLGFAESHPGRTAAWLAAASLPAATPSAGSRRLLHN